MAQPSTPPGPTATSEGGLIHVIGSLAPLFGGASLSDCLTITDPTCFTGGVATVTALARHLGSNGPSLIVPHLDKQSQFVQSHPLGWTVNRLIWSHYFGYDFYVSTASLLVQDKRDFEVSQRDLRGLQSDDFKLLLTNGAVSPSLSWHPYVERVAYHKETSLALLNVMGLSDPLSVKDPVAAIKAALDEVALRNEQTGCTKSSNDYYEEFLIANNYGQPHGHHERDTMEFAIAWDDDDDDEATRSGNFTTILEPDSSNNNTSDTPPTCWKPTIYFSDRDHEVFADMIEALRLHTNPPALVFDGGDNDSKNLYSEPTRLETPNAADPNTRMWVISLPFVFQGYYQSTMTLTDNRRWFSSVRTTVVDMSSDPLPPAVLEDPQYAADFDFVRELVRQAERNDPVVGQSTSMPVSRVSDYRRCKGGECELGNLFADALRWKSGANVAFLTSGGLRGSGWEEGPVTVSKLWEALPFPNTICTGTMMGVNLFKIVNYSMQTATFESQETTDGGRLLQVSGMKIVYNTELEGDRVISIDVWDEDSETYQPIERLRLYKFATDSFLCGAYLPFPLYLGKAGLKLDGEVPGKIGEDLHQNILGEYLRSLDKPYVATIEGRLLNDTSAMIPMDLIQTKKGCPPHTYWVDSKASCLNCPNSSHVSFSDDKLEFLAESGVATLKAGRILLVNREEDAFHVAPKSFPDWFEFSTTFAGNTTFHQEGNEQSLTLLHPGDSLALDFLVSAESLETGTATGTVSFGVLDGSGLPGCVDNNDASFDVIMKVMPSLEMNQLGNMVYFGLVLMVLSILAALGFGVWTSKNKKVGVVKTMQPLFLQMICTGVAVISLAMGSISLDDGMVSQEWCNVACMSMPWFISMGWTILFAAIHAKLWRINKLFNTTSGFQRVVVSEKDALVAFSVLFGLNFVFLLLWSLLDPLEWERLSVPGEAWNTYGVCDSGTVGGTLMGLVIAVNVGTLCLATFQAYKARNISGEFSESKKLFLAVCTWFQLIAVGLPVLFLIDGENVTARYFLQVGLLFCMCMTMITTIFVPMVRHKLKLDRRGGGQSKSVVRVTGVNLPANNTNASTTHRPSHNNSKFQESGLSNSSSRNHHHAHKPIMFHDSMLSHSTSTRAQDVEPSAPEPSLHDSIVSHGALGYGDDSQSAGQSFHERTGSVSPSEGGRFAGTSLLDSILSSSKESISEYTDGE